MVLMSMVAMPVAAASFVAVTDVDGEDGEQTWEIELDGETQSGEEIRIVTFDDSGDEIDYSNAEVSTNLNDDNLIHFSDGDSDLFVEYQVQEEDIGDTLEVTVEGIEVSADGEENYSVQLIDSDEEEELSESTFDYFVSEDSDNGDEEADEYTVTFEVDDEDGNAIEGADVSVAGVQETTDADGVVTYDLEDGSYHYSVSADGYVDIVSDDDDSVEPFEIAGEDKTVSVTLEQQTTVYEFEVVDGEDSVEEFDFAMYDAEDSLVGGEMVEVDDGSTITVDGVTVNDEYTVEVTVDEEDEDGETQEVTYSESFSAEEVADGEEYVSMTLDLGELEQVEDGSVIPIGDAGETASGWFDSLVEELEDLGLGANLSVILGGVIAILVAIGGAIFVVSGTRGVFNTVR
ncbi:hypothetical protein SAMN06264855_11029 [Halorubrum vacuolatum]|uniref:Carboxypeptidase regulatory-like domain-containing protein n=2 Tax=Halorubrum vacuolatum TaxID=63740 RepID=A0A238WTI6_HALVU|nr:hypothetical protein SAMN06264855_11029 [Halorubrum vacuolatum]